MQASILDPQATRLSGPIRRPVAHYFGFPTVRAVFSPIGQYIVTQTRNTALILPQDRITVSPGMLRPDDW